MSITGVVKVLDVPDDACLTTVRDLVLQLEKYLAVEFDTEKITNVVVGTAEPDTTDRDVIWFRIDNSGNFLGVFVFVQGQWLQMFPPPFTLFRMYGASNDLPEGYVLASADIAGISEAMETAIKATWTEHPTEDYYVIFDVVYVGI